MILGTRRRVGPVVRMEEMVFRGDGGRSFQQMGDIDDQSADHRFLA